MAEVSQQDAERLKKLGEIWKDQQGANVQQLDELADLAIKIGAAITGKGPTCQNCGAFMELDETLDPQAWVCRNCGSTMQIKSY